MEFKKFTVAGKIFPDECETYDPETDSSGENYVNQMKDEENDLATSIIEFFKFLALCHNAVIERQ